METISFRSNNKTCAHTKCTNRCLLSLSRYCSAAVESFLSLHIRKLVIRASNTALHSPLFPLTVRTVTYSRAGCAPRVISHQSFCLTSKYCRLRTKRMSDVAWLVKIPSAAVVYLTFHQQKKLHAVKEEDSSDHRHRLKHVPPCSWKASQQSHSEPCNNTTGDSATNSQSFRFPRLFPSKVFCQITAKGEMFRNSTIIPMNITSVCHIWLFLNHILYFTVAKCTLQVSAEYKTVI